jgi:hypothetical protein
MLPCEMARYIAGFSQEARKSGRLSRYRRYAVRSDPNIGLTGAVISISQRSAGISSPPLAPGAPEAEPAAAAVAGGRSGAQAAAVAPAWVAAGPLGAVEPLALPFAEPDAAGAVERPDVAAPPDAFQASARPAQWILEALRWRVWQPARALRSAFEPPAWFPEPTAWILAPESNLRLWADPPEVPVNSSHADFPGQASHRDAPCPERIRRRPRVQEVPL